MSALAMETFWLNKSACDDAERAYYEKLSGCKQTEASDDVDLFASDDEPAEAPVRVKPEPKAKQAPKKPEVQKSESAPKKVAEAPAWPNKAECNDAEAKFQAELSKLKTQEMKEEFYHPSLNYPHGPVATPKKKSRRTKKGVIEIKVLFDS